MLGPAERSARLAEDFARLFVLAHPDELGVAKVAVRRSLGQLNLRHELGLEPHTFLHALVSSAH